MHGKLTDYYQKKQKSEIITYHAIKHFQFTKERNF